jgi:hypothetical protein
MRESKVEEHFVRMVALTGGTARKAQWIGRRGCPDRWCGWPSTKRTGWVELKKPLTPIADAHQKREHERLRSCGERVDVLATIEEVDAYIEEMTGG